MGFTSSRAEPCDTFIKKMKNQAAKSPFNIKHGAIIVDGSNRIILSGCNTVAEKRVFHAEVFTFHKFFRNRYSDRRRNEKITIYVCRVVKTKESSDINAWELANSAPCEGCFSFLKKIRKTFPRLEVCYSDSHGEFKYLDFEKFTPVRPKRIIRSEYIEQLSKRSI